MAGYLVYVGVCACRRLMQKMSARLCTVCRGQVYFCSFCNSDVSCKDCSSKH